MASQKPRKVRRRISGWVVPLGILAVFALGVVGVANTNQPEDERAAEPSAAEVAYRSLQLFFAEFESRGAEPWYLWLAAFLAPLFLLGGVATLFSRRLREMVTRRTSFNHVVVFGTTPFALALARSARSTGRRVVVMHEDDDAGAVESLRRDGVRTIRADLRAAEASLAARIARAAEVIVATPVDEVNATIVEHVRAAKKAECDLFVRLDDLAMGRLVGDETAARVTPFSVPALAARAVVTPAGSAGTDLLVAGTGRLADALVLEAVRCSRAQQRAERCPWEVIVLLGPDAAQRAGRLRALVGPAADVPRVEGIAAAIDDLTRIEGPLRRQLIGRPNISAAIIAGDALPGAAAFAFAVAEHLGDARPVQLVTREQDVIAAGIGRETERDDHLSTVRVTDILTATATLQALADATVAARLAAVGAPRGTVDSLLELGARVSLGRFITIPKPDQRLLAGLDLDVSGHLEDAGVGIALTSSAALATAGDRLLKRENAELAFATWCEIARRMHHEAPIERLCAALEARCRDAGGAGGDGLLAAHRALRVLRLRIATLDYRADAASLPSREPPALRLPVLMVAGGANSMDERSGEAERVMSLLRFALFAPPFAGTIVSGGTSSGIGGVVGALGAEQALHTVGYAWHGMRDAVRDAGYDEHVAVGDHSAIDQALTAWEDLVRILAGRPAEDPDASLRNVRLLACSGGLITEQEIILARALHAEIGWLSLRDDDEPLDDRLLGGGVGVIALLDDRATVRAFLRPSRWPGGKAEREQLARHIHAAYVEVHRRRKPAGDPALKPWDELASGLRASNLAVVDDLPNKLAALGWGLERAAGGRPGTAPALGSPDAPTAELELLAELEHGRYNAERLRAGWQEGARDPDRQVTPYLTTWADLDDDARGADRELVVFAFAALRRTGWNIVTPAGSPAPRRA